jgi:hypothetical protein
MRNPALVLSLLVSLLASSVAAQERSGPVIETDDVDLFYRIYDAANGQPTAEDLQTRYIDAGSPGLRHLSEVRNVTGIRIAETIGARPEIYAEARRCAEVLPQVRVRVAEALEQFADLYPQADFPPATVAVGRGRPVAIGSPTSGIQVGLEALCATAFLNPDVEDRFVGVLVHEFVHTQQSPELADKEEFTVLEVSLAEGIAEFVTELVSGAPAYAYLAPQARGREAEIEAAFLLDKDKTDLSAWAYNTTPGKPGDLGYWVGYRIAKAYYRNAPDKREALRRILEMTDVEGFLADSGWRPGMTLD